MRLNVTLYRVMAYVTGVVLIVLCLLALGQLVTNDGAAVNVVGTGHGLLYIIYLLVSYPLTRRLRLGIWPTIMVLLAGTIPVMTFVVEQHIRHQYIAPALAAEATPAATAGARMTAAGTAASGPAAGPLPEDQA